MASLPVGAVSSAINEAVEIGALAGVLLDPWQRMILDAALSERADGTWAAKSVDVLASRQNGKNAALEVYELFVAVVLGMHVLHTAHQFKTTKKSHKRILQLLKQHPDLHSALTADYASPASGYSLEFKSKGSIEFVARSGSSGRGFTDDVLVLDEAQSLTDDQLGALMPALSARSVEGDPQVWYLGSAPGPTEFVWQRRRSNGRAGGSPAAAYFEFSADPSCDLDDRDAWAQANPGLGRRISEEFIEGERAGMSDEMFARERLSVSPEVLDTTERIWPAGVFESVVAADVPMPEHGLVFTVAVNQERSASSIGWSSAGGTCGLVQDSHGSARRPGVLWVVDELKRIALPRKATVGCSSQDGSLLLALEQAGLKVHPITPAEQRAGCVWMYDAVIERKVVVHRHPDLVGAVASAVKKPSGDGFVWDRRAGDVSALVAVTDAAYLAQGRPTGAPLMAFVVKGKR